MNAADASPSQPIPTAPPPRRRRRRWWLIFLISLLVILIAGAGVGYWAIRTNQVGNLISAGFANRLPGHLEIGHTEFNGLESVTLTDVRLMRAPGDVPAVVIDRIVATGPLWQGDLNHLKVENLRLDATAEAVRFLHELIKAEVAIKPTGPPSLLHLDFTGSVRVNGVEMIRDAKTSVAATGPIVEVVGDGIYDGRPVAVTVNTIGAGETRQYKITLTQGVLPIWKSCDALADLELLPRLPHDTHPWVPELVDGVGTVVYADKNWDLFTGQAQGRWTTGEGSAQLLVDSHQVSLSQVVVQDRDLGSLKGSAHIDTDRDRVRITSSAWSLGPRVPIPEIVPQTEILQALPAIEFVADIKKGDWYLSALLSAASGQGQATLTWGPSWPLAIDARGIPLVMLQRFVPEKLTFGAGNAVELHAQVDGTGLRSVQATVEQSRLLWGDWALGSVNGQVDIKVPSEDALDLTATLDGIGVIRFSQRAGQGQLHGDITNANALSVRLKGPEALPDLHGAIVGDINFSEEDQALVARVQRLSLKEVGVTDAMRNFTVNMDGVIKFFPQRIDIHMLGRLTAGEIRLPGSWHDLARRRPRFNAQVSISNKVVLAENILVRATDEAGNPLIDGFTAGLRGRFSPVDQSGTVIGTVDHADLAWLRTFMPIQAGLIDGECAITFTAQLDKRGVQSIDGYFLPLNAEVTLPNVLHAGGIKGSVKFRIDREEGEKKP